LLTWVKKIKLSFYQVNEADREISLSHKKTQENPWHNKQQILSKGDVVPAVITSVKS